jgi:hypothetical protein
MLQMAFSIVLLQIACGRDKEGHSHGIGQGMAVNIGKHHLAFS